MKSYSIRYTNSYFLLIASAIGLAYMLLISNTYDSGDSLQHYQISRYSWKHTYLFFDNWGKPVFTFLSSPFTQFGWVGMKLFNTLVGIITCFLLANIIQKIIPALSPYWALMLFCVPNWVLSLNSGLTEPLFACFLVSAIYFVVADKPYVSAILISFLPMVRNEGYIIMTVYACYFALKMNWKAILLLSVGTVMISILGYVILENNHDPIWIFHTTPYLSKFEKYGHGDLQYYFIAYYYLAGIPITILSIISTGCFLYEKVRIEYLIKNPDTFLWLVVGVFMAYFGAHIVFWKFGLFNSFGMNRVLLSVIPLVIIPIALLISQIKLYFSAKVYSGIVVLLVTILVLFPYSGNKSGFILPKDFKKQPELIMFQKAINEIKNRNIFYEKIYVAAPGYVWCEKADEYDGTYYSMHSFNTDSISSKTLIIYDTWFSEFENSISEETIIKKIGSDKLLYKVQTEEGSAVSVYYVP